MYVLECPNFMSVLNYNTSKEFEVNAAHNQVTDILHSEVKEGNTVPLKLVV